MATPVCGIDIIRAYELSWLNANGKPQLATLEIPQDYTKPTFDTWNFKEFIESIHNDYFVNIETLQQQISEFSTIDANFDAANIKMTLNKDFPSYTFFEVKHQANLISQGARCICQRTGQPYIGTLNLVFSQQPIVDPAVIAKVLVEFRNSEFMPQNFAAALYDKISSMIAEDFIFSLHLNRRGGISYQALRSNFKTDFAAFALRSILE